RPHAHGARVRARDDPLRGHEASASPRGRRPRRHAPRRAGEAPLPESRPDPADPRPVDRQVRRAPGVGALRAQDTTGGTSMTTTVAQTTQVYQVFIKASAEEIWEAITRPEWTARYFHGAHITITPEHYDSRSADGDVWGDSAVEVFDPPRKLVHG